MNDVNVHSSQLDHFRFRKLLCPRLTVDIPANSGDWSNPLQCRNDVRRANVSGMNDVLRSPQRMKGFRPKQSVSIRNNPNDHRNVHRCYIPLDFVRSFISNSSRPTEDRFDASLAPVIAFLIFTSLTLAASGPNDRQVTDPKSVTSTARPGVHLPALEDLFFTRLIDSAVLSPDGTEVAITTNITGSTNLWKVSASGSWPVQFAAAVDLYGPLDWFTMLKNADPLLSQYIRGLLGDPERDRKIYEEESPIHYVQNIKAPTLVLQGENDPRVPREETEQLVAALKARGNTVNVVYYPDEGHGFDKREHQIDAAARMIDWFDKHLKNR